MDLNLSGKNALVCGSSQGIGKAIAIELALLGANVTLFARNEGRLQKALKELDVSNGQSHDFLLADFANPESVKEVIDNSIRLNKYYHILINNTGGPSPGLIHQEDPQKFEEAFRQHIVVNQILTQALLPGMKSAQFGRIINVISISVKAPVAGLGVSNTIRGATASWAKTMANELGQFGITVNNILPGLTHTGRLDSLIQKRAADAGISESEMATTLESGIPVGRFGKPSEIGALAAFLASPAAAFINGTIIRADGGATPSI